MEARNSSSATRILIISTLFVAIALLLSSESRALRYSEQGSSVEASVAHKIAARLAEDSFWGVNPLKRSDFQLIVFLSVSNPNRAEFDGLVIVPELEKTFEVRTCNDAPAIILAGSGEPNLGKSDPKRYLDSEIHRYASFVGNSERSEQLITLDGNAPSLFHPDEAVQPERIAQIKRALSQLVTKRPLQITIANFSKLTDQIDVLVPSTGEMYTMSVVHKSCGEETVEVGRRYLLQSVRPGLRRKIQQNSQTITIN